MKTMMLWLLCAGLLVAGADPARAFGAPEQLAEEGIVLELYRAIVHIEPHDGAEIVVSSSLIDYDAYVESGLSEPTKDMVRSQAPQVMVQRTEHGVHITSRSQPDMIEVVIQAPRNTSSRIRITHHGEVFIEGMEANIEVKLFKGRVQLRNVSRAVSVDVGRDAAVEIDCDAVDPHEPIYAGSYDGTIRLLLPSNADVDIDARSHLGEVKSDFPLLQEEGPGSIVLRSVRGNVAVVRKGG